MLGLAHIAWKIWLVTLDEVGKCQVISGHCHFSKEVSTWCFLIARGHWLKLKIAVLDQFEGEWSHQKRYLAHICHILQNGAFGSQCDI